MNLTNSEFDRFIYNVVQDNENNFDEIKENLDLVGVTLNLDKVTDVGISPLYIQPSQMTLTAYSTKRTGDSYWRLNTMWDASIGEYYSSTIDIVSLEWDPTVGTYYDAVVPSGGPVTKRDGSKRSSGLYLFNVEDDDVNFDSYATVYVTKKTSSPLNYGTKYTHTYSTISTTVGGSASFNYQQGANNRWSFI